MSTCREPVPAGFSRRRMLAEVANGFGLLALNALLAESGTAAAADSSTLNPLSVKPPQHAPRAKRVIFLFMYGGPSQLDLFDPKPRLIADHGKPLPFEKPKLERTSTENLMASPFPFAKRGRSGLEVSALLPHIAGCADDLCVIRSLVADNVNHANALLQMNTGEQVFSRPSLGSWLLYGLGSENQNLPGFIVVFPGGGQDAGLWGSSFLPAAYQGTRIADLNRPIANLGNPRLPSVRQRLQLDALREMNQLHLREREEDSRLEARIASFELAFRMQVQAPDAFNLNAESTAVRRLYGIGEKTTDAFGRQCLLARRLVERGVRFVQLYSPGWDHHTGIRTVLPQTCAAMDRPVAGLLTDLKSRGLLQDTLVVWGGEFGRTPVAQKGDGRDHHPFGFTMWLAGGGVKPGTAYGATDEFGWHAVQDRVHVHDLHATILHLMGIDHERLTYRYNGRDYRLTDVYGKVVKGILA